MSILASKVNNVNAYRIARPGNLGSVYVARQYARLTKAYINLGYSTYWKYKYTTTQCDQIIIRCEIPQGASGYICGFKASGTNKEFSISIQDGTITYRIGNKTTSHAWEAGVHNIGFTSNLYAYFDGKIGSQLTPGDSYVAEGASGKLLVGGWMNGSSADAISSIDIYEVVLFAYYNSTVNRSEAHYYAASNGDTTNVAGLFEARNPDIDLVDRYRVGTALSGGSGSVGDRVTYGVQLHDLKFMTSSGYRDLIALMCEDWPEQASADADDADVLNGPDSKTFTSAFCLRDMPLPTGWTRVARPEESSSATTKYSKGDLIFGRKPKWHLWADNINVGKYTRETSGNIQAYNYNIFHPRYPSAGNYAPNLEQFEGYSNASSAHHDPIFDMGEGGITIEFHNGVSAVCSPSNIVPLYMTSGTASDMDDRRIYTYNANANAPQIKMALGDLVDWHISAAQQATDFNRATNPMQPFYGIMGTVNHVIYVDNDYILKPVAMAWQQTATKLSGSQYLQPLSSDTTSAEKELFQKGTVNGVYKSWGMTAVGHEDDRIFREIYLNNINHNSPTIDAKAMLELICSSTEINTAQIPSLRCRTDWVLPIKDQTITGRLDSKNSSDNNVTNFRCILMTPTVKCYETSSSTSRIDGYVYPLITISGASWLDLRDVSFDFLCAVMDSSFANEYFMKSDTYVATLEFTQFTSTVGSEALKRVSISVEMAKGSYGHTDSSVTGLPTMDSRNANSYGQALNSSSWNDSQYKSYLRCFTISSASLIAYGLKSNSTSAKLRENTTVKMWIERSADLLPKYTYATDFDFKTSMWKLQFSQKTSALSQWLFIAESSRQLTSINDALVFTFNIWDYNTSTTKYEPAALDIDSSHGISVTIYNKWYGAGAAVVDASDIICKFWVNDVSNQTGITPVQGSTNWKLDINGGTALQPYPDDREEYAGMVYGYTFRIYSSNTSSTNWGHNNLWVVIRREAD